MSDTYKWTSINTMKVTSTAMEATIVKTIIATAVADKPVLLLDMALLLETPMLLLQSCPFLHVLSMVLPFVASVVPVLDGDTVDIL